LAKTFYLVSKESLAHQGPKTMWLQHQALDWRACCKANAIQYSSWSAPAELTTAKPRGIWGQSSRPWAQGLIQPRTIDVSLLQTLSEAQGWSQSPTLPSSITTPLMNNIAAVWFGKEEQGHHSAFQKGKGLWWRVHNLKCCPHSKFLSHEIAREDKHLSGFEIRLPAVCTRGGRACLPILGSFLPA